MMAYSLVELAFALKYDSLVLFSDGLHHVADGVGLAVAFWAEKVRNDVGEGRIALTTSCMAPMRPLGSRAR